MISIIIQRQLSPREVAIITLKAIFVKYHVSMNSESYFVIKKVT